MPRFTQAELDSILSRGHVKIDDKANGGGVGSCGELQEQQADCDDGQGGKSQDDSNYRSQKEEANASDDPEFRVSIEILVSDERDRDGDGITSTIFDCLISAIGRFAKVDSKPHRIHANSIKRARRRGGNNRKD